MNYIVIDMSYLHKNGVSQAVYFAHFTRELKDALYSVYKKRNWYDYHIFSVSDEEYKELSTFLK